MRRIFFILFFFASFASNAQLLLQPAVGYGFIIPHARKMRHLVTNHIPAFSITAITPKNNAGYQILVAPLRNQYLGTAFGFNAFHYWTTHLGKLSFTQSAGAGFGYLTKCFDQTTNYKNTAIGSHVNFSLFVGEKVSYSITKSFELSAFLHLNHFSNSGFKKPNLGLNILTTGLSASFVLSEVAGKCNGIQAEIPSGWAVSYAFGVNQNDPPGSKQYLTNNLQIAYEKFSDKRRGFTFGADFFMDGTNRERLINQDSIQSTILQAGQIGLVGGWGFYGKRLGAIAQIGVYAYQLNNLEGLLYQRIGARYLLNDRSLLRISLKTHYFNADNVEIGYVYFLTKKR